MNSKYQIVDPNSGAVPIVLFMCAVAKLPRGQPQCKYYSPGTKGFCTHLGNWWEGHQRCNSQEARQGYIDRLKNLPDEGAKT